MPVTINGTTGIAGPDGSASTPAVQGTDSNTGLFYPAADTVALSTGGSERMRIDSSGNVGIGTSSISNKLEVNGSARFYTAAQGDISITHSGLISSITAAGSVGLALGTNNTEAMRINTSGNVGIGVTPPTVSQGRLLSLAYSGSGISVTSGTSLDLTNNAYYNSGWKYGQSGKTARIQLSDDQIYFGNATTGTAGNAITFTQTLAIQQGKTLALEGASLQTGTGITFPATQSASSDANTLDDYEEGTWTPSVGGNATYNYQQGNYTKVGRLVVARFAVSIGTLGTGSTTTLSGLPFSTASVTGRWGGCIHYFAGLAANAINLLIYADGASTNMLFSTVTSSGAGITVDNAAIFGNGAVVQATVIYQV